MSSFVNLIKSIRLPYMLISILFLAALFMLPLQAHAERGVNSGQPVIVVLTASWCGTCREILPIVDKIVNTFPEKGFKVITLDVDDNSSPAIAKQYGITITGSDVPQIYLFYSGKTTLLFSGKNYKFGQSKQAENQIFERIKSNLP